MHIKHLSQCLAHSELSISGSCCFYVPHWTLCLLASATNHFIVWCRSNLLQRGSNYASALFFYKSQILTFYRIKSKFLGLSLIQFSDSVTHHLPGSVVSDLTPCFFCWKWSPQDCREKAEIQVTVLPQSCLQSRLRNRALHRDVTTVQDRMKTVVKEKNGKVQKKQKS